MGTPEWAGWAPQVMYEAPDVLSNESSPADYAGFEEDHMGQDSMSFPAWGGDAPRVHVEDGEDLQVRHKRGKSKVCVRVCPCVPG